MERGIVCTLEHDSGRPLFPRVLSALGGLALYIALWGALSGMAALSDMGMLPLIPGAAAAALISLLPRSKWRCAAMGAGLALCALLFLLRLGPSLDGTSVLLNRLFAASEAKQSYTYEMFPLRDEIGWLGSLRYALLPLGLAAGTACGVRSGRAVLFVLLAGSCAWLGVTPAVQWSFMLAAALATASIAAPHSGWGGLLAAAGTLVLCAALCAGTLLLFPGEDAALSAWEEQARDTLASSTVAYEDVWATPEPTPPPEDPDQEQLPSLPVGAPHLTIWDGFELYPSWGVLAVIAVCALLLFVPSWLHDRLDRRRAKNRAGLEDPDPAAAIRALVPYAMRWLALGGLEPENIPLGGYAEQIGERFSPALMDEFRSVLPLWQEAAYSDHPMSEEQRTRARFFLELARAAAREKMGRREKLLARYVYAL